MQWRSDPARWVHCPRSPMSSLPPQDVPRWPQPGCRQGPGVVSCLASFNWRDGSRQPRCPVLHLVPRHRLYATLSIGCCVDGGCCCVREIRIVWGAWVEGVRPIRVIRAGRQGTARKPCRSRCRRELYPGPSRSSTRPLRIDRRSAPRSGLLAPRVQRVGPRTFRSPSIRRRGRAFFRRFEKPKMGSSSPGSRSRCRIGCQRPPEAGRGRISAHAGRASIEDLGAILRRYSACVCSIRTSD